ncbi:hypothetical protein [Granulicoccus sp. GXG6511]|uniref:hypothetical protein n=1 Tax=Granulicoccus sp. GXG6511 TaxID=3381351 RepID=UPI003D7C66E9
MTPTLFGRIQTRWFLLVIVGIPWTLVLMLLGALGSGAAYSQLLLNGLLVLGLVGLLGTVWEFIYHGLQQFRWEKDWPALFGFLTIINEGVVLALVMVLLDRSLGALGWFHFVTTWLLMWVWVNGPMRVLAPRWRYRGGRLF